MNHFHGERGQAHGDVFGAAFLRRGIAHPLAGVGNDGLSGGDVEGVDCSIRTLCSTRNIPLSTMVNSSNSGVWPGSSHPCGLRMCATLVADVFELTRPTYSSMSLGLLPAA